MSVLSDPVALSQIQFALTVMFHIIWPVLTIGLGLFLVVVEALWLRTGDPDYYRHARFWSRLFVLNFGIGVASGIVMEFQFGTNWAVFSAATGDFFGSILGFEGAMAFMLEAGFLGIMLFGWNRVPPGLHLFATSMVALGATLSAFWIMVASSWMHTPVGGTMEDGRYVVTDYLAALTSPGVGWDFGHMFVASLETALFVIGGISAWYILQDRHRVLFTKSLKIVILAALVVTPLQVFLGHGSGESVYHHQPAKLAAIEGHWETSPGGETADWSLLAWPDREAQANAWEITVPDLLGVIVAGDPDAEVKGLREWAPADQPALLPVIFYSFRGMVAIGLFFVALTVWSLWRWGRGQLRAEHIGRHRRFLWAWVAAAPLGYVAVELGWLVRELGRQPWILYGQLRVEDAASNLPAASVLTTLGLFVLTYVILFAAAIYFGARLLRHGPDPDLVIPEAPSAHAPEGSSKDDRPADHPSAVHA